MEQEKNKSPGPQQRAREFLQIAYSFARISVSKKDFAVSGLTEKS